MKSLIFNLLVLLLLTGSGNPANLPGAKRPGKKAVLYNVRVQPNFQAPVLDAQLTKDEWKNAGLIYNFTQKEPQEGEPASEPTFVLITYDEENIYFGIRCFDKEPERIVANEMRRDRNLADNDYVEIIIDTFHDQRNAYYFATNSLGARLDCEIKSEGEHLNWDWDGVWRSVAMRDELGWTVEVAIPFQTLRFNNAESLTWGINFGRYIPRKREESYWSPISRDDDFDSSGKFKASKFGTLTGLRNVRHQNRFQFKPYTLGGLERDFEFGRSNEVADIGLDAKYHITSNIVSDLTINTDFAQVEADAEQVNLSRFSLFFPEKRDFFLEGLDVFNVGEDTFFGPFTKLFFSRRIGLHRDAETFTLREVPIMGGVKITGKEGPYELGVLNVLTDELNYTNSLNTRFNIPQTNYSAVRIKRDVFKRSHIGFIGLSKDPLQGGQYNRTFAVDGRFSFDNNLAMSGYLAKTETPGLDGKDYNVYGDIMWGTDLFSTKLSYTDIGANFNPEMGFLQWTDVRKYHVELAVSPRPKFLNTRQTHFTYDLDYITDHDNELQYRTIDVGIFNEFKDQSYFFLGYTNFYDNVPFAFTLGTASVPADIYEFNVLGASYASDLSKKVSGFAQVSGGSFYDGTFLGASAANYIRPSDKVSMDFSWEWNRIDLPVPNGKFDTNIFGARFNYSFTTDLFAKLFLQWNDFDERMISNFLLHFIHSPGSDFYLVYNEEWNTGSGLDTANRTLLGKVTYRFDF